MNKIKLSGHRGYRAQEIENTRKAILRAIKEKIDYIEIDIRKTKDEELVLFHDSHINRLLNGRAKIENLTLNNLKQFSYKDGQKIITLDEVFSLIKDKISAILDIKARKVEKKIINLIENHEMSENVIIQSFSGKAIKDFHKFNPNLHYCLYRTFIGKAFRPYGLFTKLFYKKLVKRYPISYLSLDGPFIYDKFLKLARNDGIKIILGALRTKNYLSKIDDWGISIINADDPAKIREMLRNLKKI